jgi:cyanophycinase-like exopeptidase
VPARLVIIGSGETSPTMVKVHRELLATAGGGSAAMLDTPFGFQANADDLTDKIGEYFRDSVGVDIAVATWRRRDEPVAVLERTLALLGRASWAFAGPGSPSYALRQWADTPMPAALAEIVRRGGSLVMGSAAAVTVGSASLPVYEIYKVGDEARWLPGLDLLGTLTGISAAVIPHYDNREGGRHDTRYCYMGEQRLLELEEMLPADVGILGVDEHTAVLIDVESGAVDIMGAGGLTLRYRDRQTVIPAGESTGLDHVAAALRGESAVPGGATSAPPRESIATPATASTGLRADAEARREAFRAALVAGDAERALEETLGLEQDIHSWSADTLQSDDIDVARAILRAMLVDLATAARTGLRDEREVIGPFVDLLLEARQRARDTKDFGSSDALRDGLIALGIEVRDTPDGVTWERSTP